MSKKCNHIIIHDRRTGKPLVDASEVHLTLSPEATKSNDSAPTSLELQGEVTYHADPDSPLVREMEEQRITNELANAFVVALNHTIDKEHNIPCNVFMDSVAIFAAHIIRHMIPDSTEADKCHDEICRATKDYSHQIFNNKSNNEK